MGFGCGASVSRAVRPRVIEVTGGVRAREGVADARERVFAPWCDTCTCVLALGCRLRATCVWCECHSSGVCDCEAEGGGRSRRWRASERRRYARGRDVLFECLYRGVSCTRTSVIRVGPCRAVGILSHWYTDSTVWFWFGSGSVLVSVLVWFWFGSGLVPAVSSRPKTVFRAEAVSHARGRCRSVAESSE